MASPSAKSALNDIVVSRGAVSRLIGLDVSVDGELVTRYRCDGLIISSPDRFHGLFAGSGRRGGVPDGGSVCPHAHLPSRAFQPLHHSAAVLDHPRQGHQSRSPPPS